MTRNMIKWANAQERHFEFNIGEARYTARPVKAGLPNLNSHAKQCLVTLLPAQARDLDDENWLETNLRAFRGLQDDVWTNDFLDGLIISTLTPLPSSPSPALAANIRRLTSWHAIVPGLDLPVSTWFRRSSRVLCWSLIQTGGSVCLVTERAQSSLSFI